MRFEVLTVVKMSILDFWVVTTHGLVVRSQRFGGDILPPSLGLKIKAVFSSESLVSKYKSTGLKMEAVCSSETLVSTYRSTN
jgi:hypothetical protein